MLPAHAGLVINPTFDSSVTSLANAAQIQTAFLYAASQFTQKFSDPITINITVVAQAGTGVLGQSSTFIQGGFSYAQIKAALQADVKSGTDSSVLANLPSSDPVGTTHTYTVATAQGKALGLLGASTDSDGTFTFGAGYTYALDPNNRAVSGAYDFIGVAEHEISEIMGRFGLLGVNDTGSPDYGVLDLMGYTSAGNLSLNRTNTGVYFSVNGGVTNLHAFNNPGGGDLRDWASGQGADAFNAFSSSGVQNDLSTVDLTIMDAIGYDAAPEPGTFGLGLGAVAAYFIASSMARAKSS